MLGCAHKVFKTQPFQVNRLLEHFVAGTTARIAAELVGVYRYTLLVFYHPLRERIAQELETVNSECED